MDGYYVKLLAVRMNKQINISDKLLKCVLIKYPKWQLNLLACKISGGVEIVK